MAREIDPALTDEILQGVGEPTQRKPAVDSEPLYQIYEDSKIPVSRAVGTMHKTMHNTARTAYTHIYESWNEVYRYYNHDQVKSQSTQRGTFKRGDNTENIVYSNINTILPATYSKNPNITVNVLDGGKVEFQKALEALINRLIRMKSAPGVNLKAKAKKLAMMAELTNQGTLKIDFVGKNDGREVAVQQMEELQAKLKKAKNQKEVEEIYGQLQALEMQVETREPSGFKATAPVPHDVLVDPYAVEPDASDAGWIMEHTFLPTEYLNARFTKKGKGDKADSKVLTYKPTHKASFDSNSGDRDDGIGLVMENISGDTSVPTDHTDQERLSYLYRYYTEVVYVWDKTTRRVFLYDYNDWTWPIWVWDDYLHLSRFFPYFFTQFSLSTGGMVSVGATSYYLDHQDTINDINRKLNRMRKSVFDNLFYNSNSVDRVEVEKFAKALRGETTTGQNILGVKAEPGQKLSELIEVVGLSGGKEIMALFDKADLYAAVDRISATSDALRGAQFKANTTEDAVQAYVDATRLRIGAKIDAIEDTIADFAIAMAEICVQFFDVDMVRGLIGEELSKGWEQCSVEDLHANYTIEIVAGSIEKPTSVFKKKEAIEVVQSIGQFAKVAPGATLLIILRVLQNAFTEVNIKPEEWKMLEAAVAQGIGQMGGGGEGGGEQQGGDLQQEAMSLPEDVKVKAMQMKQEGATSQEIAQFLQQAVQKHKGMTGGGQRAEEPPPTVQ